MRKGLLLPRHPADAVRAVLAVGILVLIAMVVHRDRVGTVETDVFRVLNDLPKALFPALWVVMQLGNIVAVPVVATAVALLRRFRLAAEIALAGGGVWLLAKVVKQLVQRGRPSALLPDVHIHGAAAAGRGYLSGHAAVAFAMATLIAPYLPRRARHVLWGLALTVCAARVYVGSHLPLDVVGGAALGWGVASVAHLVLGAPSGRPSGASVRRALLALGVAVVSVEQVNGDGRRAASFAATTNSGDRRYVKVISRGRRDYDLLYRIWVAATKRGSHASPGERAAHEAAMQLAAAAAGVRTPTLVAVGSTRNGTGVLVNRWVDAVPAGRAGLDDTAVADLRRQLALLRDAHIAHGQICPANVLVDDKSEVWIVDFGRARLAASDAALDADQDAALALAAATGQAARLLSG